MTKSVDKVRKIGENMYIFICSSFAEQMRNGNLMAF